MTIEHIFTALFVAFIGGILGGSATIWNNERKIEADRKNFKDTMKADADKLKADLIAQSSKTYKELITAERIKWLDLLRESMINFLTRLTLIIQEKNNNNFKDNHCYEIVKLSFAIKLKLNPNQENHSNLLEEISKIMFIFEDFLKDKNANIENNEIVSNVGKLSLSCQELLKSEWNQVKREAEELYK